MEGERQATCWVSGLYHKLLNDTVEDMLIIVAILRMNTEVLNSFGTTCEERYVSHRGRDQHRGNHMHRHRHKGSTYSTQAQHTGTEG